MMKPRKRNKRLALVVVVSIAVLSLTGCIETKPLLQGRRDGTASVTTNRVYHGCGYRKRGLADYSLRWMIEKANEHGLAVTESPIIGDNANDTAEFHDSGGFWYGVASFFKKGHVHTDRILREGDLFHWSASDERAQFLSEKPSLPPETMIAYTSRKHENETVTA